MTGKDRFLQLIREESAFFKSYGIEELGLFGSVARGEEKAESDFDVLVKFEEGKKSFRNFVAVSDFLEERLGGPVDLVTVEGLSPHIGPSVLEETYNVPLAS
ncbi:nucleotidyltransferase family protein [Puniceicoccus vermicola]|uniref:Nucleotidyltransferase family protein n=1 Tax=Puniceicoccus vermicola TaxID=388746 RepID=A0A7X1AWT7_9BACT|nr:nucleotidyltransferase family protein [Puniceicoccus vermicola]MBC2601239.1 nucleotidyltransferase family protein [Puniceicoccus vermicola]